MGKGLMMRRKDSRAGSPESVDAAGRRRRRLGSEHGGVALSISTQQTQDRSSDLPYLYIVMVPLTRQRLCIPAGRRHWQSSHVVDSRVCHATSLELSSINFHPTYFIACLE